VRVGTVAVPRKLLANRLPIFQSDARRSLHAEQGRPGHPLLCYCSARDSLAFAVGKPEMYADS
jgi:hypothetical protein